jgi:hypothetical protein
MRMLIDGADNQTGADPSLLRIVAHAPDIQGRLNQNTELTVHYVAREVRVAATYIYALLLLPGHPISPLQLSMVTVRWLTVCVALR